ncbi:hypothetical protein EJB05_25788, partial [Eragrostis curvula]
MKSGDATFRRLSDPSPLTGDMSVEMSCILFHTGKEVSCLIAGGDPILAAGDPTKAASSAEERAEEGNSRLAGMKGEGWKSDSELLQRVVGAIRRWKLLHKEEDRRRVEEIANPIESSARVPSMLTWISLHQEET